MSLSSQLKKYFNQPVVDGTFAPLFYLRSSRDWGIGDTESLLEAICLTKNLKQNIFEILPLNYSSAFESPYSVLSSKLLNTLYISVDWAVETLQAPKTKQWIQEQQLIIQKLRSLENVNYSQVRELKTNAFAMLFEEFQNSGLNTIFESEWQQYIQREKDWIWDHILFIHLREKFISENPSKGWDFRTWPLPFRLRDSETLKSYREQYLIELEKESFLQWLLQYQLSEINMLGKKENISIMGDIPFALDGADLWINPEIFGLEKPHFKRNFTQGVPPDMFSDFGQYWQFYPYNWTDKTKSFLKDRLDDHQDIFSTIRLDHVLGYYRAYLFYEDPDNSTTLEKLGLYAKIKEIRHRGLTYNWQQGDLAWDVYRLFLDSLRQIDSSFQKDLVQNFFSTVDPYLIQEDCMLLLARPSLDPSSPPLFWERNYCVEKAIFEDKPMWDYLKISKKNSYQIHTVLCSYLFGPIAPKPCDSLRPCFFEKGPGESLLSDFLKLCEKKGSILISEALGVVPDSIIRSLQKIKMTNYVPMIYGLTPNCPKNIFHPINHDENGFITFALHDSKTLKTWWQELDVCEKKDIIEFLNFSENLEKPFDYSKEVQFQILKSVYQSSCALKVLLWTDIFPTDESGAINKPGSQMGQWVSRMPKNLQIKDLIQACQTKKETTQSNEKAAKEAITLLRKLKKSNPLKQVL